MIPIKTFWHNKYARTVPLLYNFLKQKVTRPNVSVIGSVHRNNVGDMALSGAVRDRLKTYSVRSGLCSIGGGPIGLLQWPTGDKAILAGGAVGREKLLRRVVRKYSGVPQSVAMTGMSFWDIDSLSQQTQHFLRSVSYLSCRNRQDVQELAEKGIQANFAFDNAFSLPTPSAARGKKLLGVNVVARHMAKKNGNYVSLDDNPFFGPSYIKLMRRTVTRYLSMGWKIRHVPFTSDDALFSEYVFRDLDVNRMHYSPDYEKAARRVAECNRFVATRYHAHVFAIKSGTPLYSISYAPKCRLLRRDLNIPSELQVLRSNLVGRADFFADSFTSNNGFVLPESDRRSVETSAQKSIDNAIEALGGV